jgi:hypothetical protein
MVFQIFKFTHSIFNWIEFIDGLKKGFPFLILLNTTQCLCLVLQVALQHDGVASCWSDWEHTFPSQGCKRCGDCLTNMQIMKNCMLQTPPHTLSALTIGLFFVIWQLPVLIFWTHRPFFRPQGCSPFPFWWKMCTRETLRQLFYNVKTMPNIEICGRHKLEGNTWFGS